MPSIPLPTGKLPARHLDALLARLPRHDSRVVVGPQLGEDAAVIDFGDRYLVLTTDPVTFAIDRIGWYAVHINANDVAVMGARPRWFSAVLLLPQRGTTDALVEAIMLDVSDACQSLGATVCGGHTEITSDLDRPIVIGQMLGEVDKQRLASKSRLRAGDRILLTRGVAIEGSALLAREKAEYVRRRLPADLVDRAGRLLFDPGISVVEAALTACESGVVHAMHDPTEGGIQTGLFELAAASGLGLEIHADAIPVLSEAQALCDLFGLDPLKLIASGALLIAAPGDQIPAIRDGLEQKGIPASVIGEVRPPDHGLTIERHGLREPLVPAERDEIARVWDTE